ncbi:MAG: PilZ domain-containing protein [Lachnospiraceae bacterium]|nr:PilZ domain-containing protein [Lachnospiraceae bacterium]MCI9151590.1 PilZ domain-containing protein [Lachnospiraceae bacterium]
MEERRRYKRLDLEVTLELERLDEGEIETLRYARVSVEDLSKTGIGFCSSLDLEVGSIYNAKLLIWTKEVIWTVIKIVRRVEKDGQYEYGGHFVGMTEADALKIQIYQMFQDAEEEQEGR